MITQNDCGRLLQLLLAAALLLGPCLAAVAVHPDLQTHAVATNGVIIARPREGYLYLHDRELLPVFSGDTIIIGKITVLADVTENMPQLKQMAFLLDGDTMHICPQPPYLWTWNSRVYGRGFHTLQVIATTMSESDVAAWQNVTVISLRRGS
ncbi:MAG: hypothetical protein ACP5FL_08730 [Thermoplasmatota archaeon]